MVATPMKVLMSWARMWAPCWAAWGEMVESLGSTTTELVGLLELHQDCRLAQAAQHHLLMGAGQRLSHHLRL